MNNSKSCAILGACDKVIIPIRNLDLSDVAISANTKLRALLRADRCLSTAHKVESQHLTHNVSTGQVST